ncbi:MAG: deoxyribodipyrimidine photo-lyase [Woeseiaceae bacterium]|nr:deoxyribodipyrimidine photo-lyase [Woeseiaceae bacterium]
MTTTATALVWFRQDLRLADNPALHAAAASGARVLPVFIDDVEMAEEWQPGPASRWWLQRSLAALNASLDGNLLQLRGNPATLIPELARKLDVDCVYWNRCYEPWRIRNDHQTKERLLSDAVSVRTFNGSLLWDPSTIKKPDGTPYRVFTPFYRKGCLENGAQPRRPLPEPDRLRYVPLTGELRQVTSREFTGFVPPDIDESLWQPGERGALATLDHFLESAVSAYDVQRDIPGVRGTSRLSTHLHFGEISPNQVWYAVRKRCTNGALSKDGDRFLSEIGWREFSHYLLYHNPELPSTNLQRRFDRFPWGTNDALLGAWQRGDTGFPIIDAGMRELARTGYMHNRVRMVTASFLVKNLLIDWRQGERWFWENLLDADLANNSASWQWVAGCGADAAPYFRIFNPVTQGKKFDPAGAYVRRFVPVLAELPDKYIQNPFDAPADVLAQSGVRLGDNYPEPVVDLARSRQVALDAYRSTGAGA